jgi:hypothetical protein
MVLGGCFFGSFLVLIIFSFLVGLLYESEQEEEGKKPYHFNVFFQVYIYIYAHCMHHVSLT